MVKETEINPHAKEAWKVTKSTVKGTQYNNCTLMFLVNLISCYTLKLLLLFLGAGKVFSDLEKGARVMIRTAGKETSKTAEHKLA